MTGLRISGLALPFNSETFVAGRWESVAPGALRFSGRNVKLFHASHDPQTPWASTGHGTLSFAVDDFGLWFSATLSNREGALAVVEAVRGGFIDGASVNFVGLGWHDGVDGTEPFRRIESASIDHVALVHNPAYPDTAVWWDNEDPSRLPPRLRDLSRRHNAAFTATPAGPGRAPVGRAAARGGVDIAASSRRCRPIPAVPASVIALLRIAGYDD